jgi:metal-responsive CopG/Arc/MetJ family transcriptional regulator
LGYNKSYTVCMKTAISIPNNIFESAEKLANQLGKSRSQLYTQALTRYIKEQRGDNVTRKLNEVYGNTGSSLDLKFRNLQSRSLPKDKW